MNNQEFMGELKKLLRRLPHEEYNEAINYYEQYFEDGGVINETPKQAAMNILADFVGRPDEKSSGQKVLVTILTIFSLPILAPLGASLAAVVACLYAVMFSLLAAGGAVALGGLASAVASVRFLFVSPQTTVFFFGAGLLCIAVGMALVLGSWALIKKSSVKFAKIGGSILRRFTR
jgi:uncharacterized membrane protein